MDRRQQKTRRAIFDAFITLLDHKRYAAVTVQDIIDAADIGRSTFYAHFETKDELLRALCSELFDHILATVRDRQDSHGLYACTDAPDSAICHILRHLQEDDNHILTLLSGQNNALFLRYFKSGMDAFVREQFLSRAAPDRAPVPQEFLINHISGAFVEMVHWWLETGRRQTPEELDAYFRAVTEPLL